MPRFKHQTAYPLYRGTAGGQLAVQGIAEHEQRAQHTACQPRQGGQPPSPGDQSISSGDHSRSGQRQGLVFRKKLTEQAQNKQRPSQWERMLGFFGKGLLP